MIYFGLILALVILSNFLSAIYTLHFAPLSSTPTPPPTPTPTSLPDNNLRPSYSGISYSQFIYPDANQTNDNDNTFTSNDDIGVITNWYKQAIKDSG